MSCPLILISFQTEIHIIPVQLIWIIFLIYEATSFYFQIPRGKVYLPMNAVCLFTKQIILWSWTHVCRTLHTLTKTGLVFPLQLQFPLQAAEGAKTKYNVCTISTVGISGSKWPRWCQSYALIDSLPHDYETNLTSLMTLVFIWNTTLSNITCSHKRKKMMTCWSLNWGIRGVKHFRMCF